MVPRTVLMGRRLQEHAERDLHSASMMLQPGGYYVAANLASQAAEKSLKAAHWHLRAEEPPWTHDLGDLAERVTESTEDIPAAVLAAVSQLGPMFDRSRYPSGNAEEPIPPDLITEEDARLAIYAAEDVVKWVRTLLLRAHGRPGHR